MERSAYTLVGFREDTDGAFHAAFNFAPTGPFAFEVSTPKRVVEQLSSEQQELWAQRQMRTRGASFHGLYVSDLG